MRLAVVVSHPIQYYAPLWRALARAPGVDLRVLFASRVGLDKTYDAEMRTELAWATELTAGYDHEFLPEAARFQRTGFHLDNPSVGAALARFRPDAVVLHGYASKTLLRALIWCKTHGARALLMADSSADRAPPGWRRRVKRLILPHLLRRYDAALTLGDRGEAHLAALGFPRARMARTPTVMDEAFWGARAARARLRAETRAALRLAESDFVVLAAAKLSPRKRIADLVAAGHGLKLVIAGDGGERQALQRQAAEAGVDARFLGFVNLDRLPALYAAADVFAHPAENEPYGMVAIEAAIVGLPLVMTEETGAVGPTSIARPGDNALVYASGDVAALAAHLTRLRDDPTLRAKMANASLLLSLDHAGEISVASVLAAAGAKKATQGDLPKR